MKALIQFRQELRVLLVITLVLIGIALALYSRSIEEEETNTINQSEGINLSIVVMTRDQTKNLAFIFQGPIRSEKYNVTIRDDSTIRELENEVFKLTNLSHFEQKDLLFKGIKLEGRKTLQFYNITDGSKIHVFTFEH
jgi:hypothetical protein